MKVYDYIIVGAGSAGCVLANRLSADPNCDVLLLEAGGSDRHPFIRMPSAFSLPMNSKRFNWQFTAEPEPALGGRRLHCPRGKLIGGSSSINGMVHVRGHPRDFDRWQKLGAQGWGYADVLPYFRKAERALARSGSSSYRGDSGPLTVSRGEKRNPLYGVFLNACEQAGYALSDDLNGFQQEGFGDLEMTVAGGVRCSSAQAYLRPALQRSNLTLLKHASVDRVVFSNKSATGVNKSATGVSKTATGVEFRRGNASSEFVTARQSVLLAAGAIGSPQLLMLSGIGPADELKSHGIAAVEVLAGVGQNLMDHLEVYFQQACTQPVSLNRWLNPLGKGLIGARWLLARSGLGATNHFEVGGFARSRIGVPWPDIQFHFLPAAISYDGSVKAASDGFQVHVGPMLSPSRGELRLRSAKPTDKPILRFNYMSREEDWQVFRSAVRLAREIFAQSAFDDYRGE